MASPAGRRKGAFDATERFVLPALGAKTFADFADAVRAALGGEAFASAWAEGRVMALAWTGLDPADRTAEAEGLSYLRPAVQALAAAP